MSLSGALSSAISALSAQSQSLAMVSDNIANADTNGYKTNSAMFADMVTNSSSAQQYSSGGVSVSSRANISQQGLLATTTNATDVAIQGNGFFAVTTATTGGTTLYTRDGAFTTDKDGYLENNGYYLQGYQLDASGKTISGLEPIKTTVAQTSAGATTTTTVVANLPADAASGATFESSMTAYDSLGTANSIQITWTKSTTANEWTATFGNPTLSSDGTTSNGTTTSGPVTVTFNTDGSLASTNPSPPTVGVTWSDGSVASTITMNLGTVGKSDGLTQYASGETTPTVNVTNISSDGLKYGTLSSVSVGKNGLVNATYSNGQTVAIYKIPVATFNDPNGLAAQSNGMYSATAASGNVTMNDSGQNSAGTVYGSELESSTTDTSGQFSNMISAQQAYSAASQVISTVNKMFDTLISSMR